MTPRTQGGKGGVFSSTVLDRVKYGLSRLTYGMATWCGLDARKLAAEVSAAGRTAVVVACRFPPRHLNFGTERTGFAPFLS